MVSELSMDKKPDLKIVVSSRMKVRVPRGQLSPSPDYERKIPDSRLVVEGGV